MKIHFLKKLWALYCLTPVRTSPGLRPSDDQQAYLGVLLYCFDGEIEVIPE